MLEKEISSPKTKQCRRLGTAAALSAGGEKRAERKRRGVPYTALQAWQLWYPSIHPAEIGVARAPALPYFDKRSFPYSRRWALTAHPAWASSPAVALHRSSPLTGKPGSLQIRAAVSLLMLLSSTAPSCYREKSCRVCSCTKILRISPQKIDHLQQTTNWVTLWMFSPGAHAVPLMAKVAVELPITCLSPKPCTPPQLRNLLL